MRTLLKIHIETGPGNEAIRNGSLPKTIESLVTQLRPESTYFFTDHAGRRCAHVVFDLDDPSQIPPIAEPLFMNLGAAVEFVPVMNLDDLQRGLHEATKDL
jgi:hypothetical protein